MSDFSFVQKSVVLFLVSLMAVWINAFVNEGHLLGMKLCECCSKTFFCEVIHSDFV